MDELAADFVIVAAASAVIPVPQIANGTWTVAVRSRAQKRGMVGRDQNAIVPLALQKAMQRADDVGIDPLEHFDFFLGVPFVRRFVAGFDVHDDEVDGLQRVDRVTAFGGVIGVEYSPSRRAR